MKAGLVLFALGLAIVIGWNLTIGREAAQVGVAWQQLAPIACGWLLMIAGAAVTLIFGVRRLFEHARENWH